MTVRVRLGDRSAFRSLEARAYLAHAAVSPLSSPVVAALDGITVRLAARGLDAAVSWFDELVALRAIAARLLGADDDEIAIVPSTTHGIQTIAMSLPWRRGDRVILFHGEFPTNVTPWRRAAELFGLEVVMLPLSPFLRSHDEGIATLDAALSGGCARLVAVSAVQFQTGLAMPIAAMAERAHAAGAELFVDAIQALGVMPFDVRSTGADYVAAGGHKWLMGAEGAGLLYVARRACDRLVPRLAGWLSHERPFSFLTGAVDELDYDRPLRRDASALEPGGALMHAVVALRAAIELLLELDVRAVFEHATAYLDALEPSLVELGLVSARSLEPAARSAILSCRAGDVSLEAVRRALHERGVTVSTPDGHLRFAPHWPNPLDEVPLVAQAVRDVLRAAG